MLRHDCFKRERYKPIVPCDYFAHVAIKVIHDIAVSNKSNNVKQNIDTQPTKDEAVWSLDKKAKMKLRTTAIIVFFYFMQKMPRNLLYFETYN